MLRGSSSSWYGESSPAPAQGALAPPPPLGLAPPPPPRHLGKYGRYTGLSLVTCPKCGEEVIELVSKTTRNPGQIFFKCCTNVIDDPTTCKFYMFAEKYKRWIEGGCPVAPSGTVTRNNPRSNESFMNNGFQMTTTELKEEVQLLKKQLASVKEDVAMLKSFVLAVGVVLVVAVVVKLLV